MFDIPKTMRAVVYRGANDLRLETVPVPAIGANELLVKVAVCGVCPTDIKKIHYGLVPPPRIFGHETAGTIVKIGGGKTSLRVSPHSSKTTLKVGDRVALHHHIPCMECHFCRHRAFAQCATYKRTGITAGFEPAGGGYAEYVRVMPFVLPGVVKIPAKNTFEEAAMLEPLNTVLKAVYRLNLLPGDRVLVAGQGPIGLMFTKLLKLRGIHVLVTDLLASRLKLAKKFGAKWTVNLNNQKLTGVDGLSNHVKPSVASPSPGGSNERSECHVVCCSDVGRGEGELKLKTQNLNFKIATALDAAIIAVPSDAAVKQSLELIRGAGQVLLFAHTKRGDSLPVDLASICLDEKDLIGSYSADFTIQNEVARLIFSRQFDMRPLITHRFPLEKTADAVALASHPAEDSLKIVVTHD